MHLEDKNLSATTTATIYGTAKAALRDIIRRIKERKQESNSDVDVDEELIRQALTAGSSTGKLSNAKIQLSFGAPHASLSDSWLATMSKKASVKKILDTISNAINKHPEDALTAAILTNGVGTVAAPSIINDIASDDFVNNKLPAAAAEAGSEANFKALVQLVKKIKKDKIGLHIGEGIGGPAYDGIDNTIYFDTAQSPLHAGILAHELGHAKVHHKLKSLLGDKTGDVVSTYGSGLLGNVVPDAATALAVLPALAGKTKASLITGGIGSALMLPRLLDEGVSSWWGKKWLDDRGLAGGDKAWDGFGTYAAAAAAPLAPAAVSGTTQKILKFLSKGKLKKLFT